MKIQAFFIYADDCPHCKAALLMIESISVRLKVECEILQYLYDSPAGLGIAANNDILDLPGVVISGGTKKFVLVGKDVTEENLTDAIRKASK